MVCHKGLALVVVLLAPLVPSGAGAIDLLQGRALKFLNREGVNKDRAQLTVVKDTSITAPLPDGACPAESSVTFRTDSLVLAPQIVGPIALDCNLWSSNSGETVRRYKDPGMTTPIERITLRYAPAGGVLMIKAKGPLYGASAISGPIVGAEVELTVDGVPYCTRFESPPSAISRNEPELVLMTGPSTLCIYGPTATATPTSIPTIIPEPTSLPSQTATNTVPTNTPTQTSTGTVPTNTPTRTRTNTPTGITPTQTTTTPKPTSTWCTAEWAWVNRDLPAEGTAGVAFTVHYLHQGGGAGFIRMEETLPSGWQVLSPPWSEHSGDTYVWVLPNYSIPPDIQVLPPAGLAAGTYHFYGETTSWHPCNGESTWTIGGDVWIDINP
jgi:hypothetical protein